MYPVLLTVHSWIRWILVLTAGFIILRSGYALFRGRAYSFNDARLAKGFLGALNLQLLVGIILYVALSPMVRVAWSDWGAAMASSPLRFFAIEHQVAAVVAIGIGHAGISWARRGTDDRARHRRALLGAAGCLLMILIAIPWPFLPYGRALLRL